MNNISGWRKGKSHGLSGMATNPLHSTMWISPITFMALQQLDAQIWHISAMLVTQDIHRPRGEVQLLCSATLGEPSSFPVLALWFREGVFVFAALSSIAAAGLVVLNSSFAVRERYMEAERGGQVHRLKIDGRRMRRERKGMRRGEKKS